MSSLSQIRKETAGRMGDANDTLPCQRCQTATPRATLSSLGARCFACYQAYCREVQAQPTRRLTLAEKKAALEKLGGIAQ